MNLEFLFEKIRKKEVILWIGAGFSKYAGMPSSENLKDKLITELVKRNSNSDESYLKGLPLKTVAENFVRACNGSRNDLNRILKDNFKIKYDDTTYHDILSRLPFFKIIITTNYDSLIEDSYQNRCHVVRYKEDLTYIDDKLPVIIKAHGDLQNLNDIIITEKDYSQINNFQSPIWNYIKSISTNRDILFLGYGYEDSNVWYLFEKLAEELGSHGKQKFLITPSISEDNNKNLVRQGIEVLKMTGQFFISELEKNIIDNIISDFWEGRISTETLNEYLKYRDLNSVIKSENDKVFIEKITNSKGEIDLEINFSLDAKIANDFQNFQNGFSDELEYKFLKEDILEFTMYNFGLKDYLNLSNIKELIVQNVGEEFPVFIERKGSDIYFEKIMAKRYSLNNKTVIVIDIGNYTLKLVLDFSNKEVKIKTELSLCDIVDKIKENQKLFELLVGATKEDPLILSVNKDNSLKFYDFITKDDKGIIKNLNGLFNQLRAIEKVCKVKFKKIDLKTISKQDMLNLNFLFKMITKGYYLENNKDKTLPISNKSLNKILTDSVDNILIAENVIGVVSEKPIYVLFDEELTFGFLSIETRNPYVFKKEKTKSHIKSKN